MDLTMKKRFSDRIGVTKPSTVLQLNGMTDGLRNRIWNALREDALASWTQTDAGSLPLFEIISDRFLKLALDDTPRIAIYQIQFLHEILLKRMEWYEVYNLTEFVIENYRQAIDDEPAVFVERVNTVLEEEMSGYRVIKSSIVPITSEAELESIESSIALAKKGEFTGAETHFQTALKLFAKKPESDYRNCIKEAISAVESLVTTISSEKDFGQALQVLRKKLSLHPAFVSAVEKLYGYTSDEDGIRHGIFDTPDVGFDEAKFMLVACSALINFLISKTSRNAAS